MSNAEVLEITGAYKKATEFFDLVAFDMACLKDEPLCADLSKRQMLCADSICVNIERCAGRQNSGDSLKYLDLACASIREAKGRYVRLSHWVGRETAAARLAFLDEVLNMVGYMIQAMGGVFDESPRTEIVKKNPTVFRHNPTMPRGIPTIVNHTATTSSETQLIQIHEELP